MNDEISLRVDREQEDLLLAVLIKAIAEELSTLRATQTQISVYGPDRRSALTGVVGQISRRHALLEELLRQAKAQAKR